MRKLIICLFILASTSIFMVSCEESKETQIGGKNGIVVNESDSKTEVKIGGEKVISVDH